MNYYEIHIEYSSSLPKEIIHDVLANELAGIDFESFKETDKGMAAYIQEPLFSEESMLQQLEEFPLADVTFTTSKELIIARDWNEEWEKNYFKPIRIGKECIIRASFHEKEEGFAYPIMIDPKMAFGTGNHETTFLMINEMLQLDIKEKEVLDMGCGTGVLAILAQMMGAKRTVAIDIDKWAYENTLDNIRLNHTEEITVALGGAERIAEFDLFDYIFANINRNILLQDIQSYIKQLRTKGMLYMSGFYREDIPVIEEECRKWGLSITSIAEKNKWVAIRTER